eukprot:CAMPEP_0197395444 /NCGR_PEP_ID=MMETSP1165-20131217/7087_1 /TAXON_ID=284809 /ORGANISM="Chrysocystis fragilis, Strain CCMP3189" /LENGTH=198 /DNA_ID=CAMNT_0042921207 /DNA_START=242 /DNA_END=835 /DNA_ORIENTATION=-
MTATGPRLEPRGRSLVSGLDGGVVFGDLLDEGQELSVEGDDDALFTLDANGLADGEVEIDGRHDAVAELLVDQVLDGHAVVRDGLVSAVDVGLLEDLAVEAADGAAHHRVERLVREGREDPLQLRPGRLLQLGLAQQELAHVAVRVTERRGDLVVRLPRRFLRREALLGDRRFLRHHHSHLVVLASGFFFSAGRRDSR